MKERGAARLQTRAVKAGCWLAFSLSSCALRSWRDLSMRSTLASARDRACSSKGEGLTDQSQASFRPTDEERKAKRT